jgi:hypothetical protein
MANEGKTVLVAALDGTFQRKEFANILKLVPIQLISDLAKNCTFLFHLVVGLILVKIAGTDVMIFFKNSPKNRRKNGVFYLKQS